MSLGYSGTPLARKLGVTAGMRIALLDAPTDFVNSLGPLPERVGFTSRLGGHVDLVMVFVLRHGDLVRRLPAVRTAIAPNGMVWVAWPKRTSLVQADMTENVIREVVLPTGLVDVKVCAVDETWSGLKLVIRKEQR